VPRRYRAILANPLRRSDGYRRSPRIRPVASARVPAYGLTVSSTVALLAMDPLVPLMVSVKVPLFVLLLVVMVSVELFELLEVGFGLKEAVDRGGSPLTLRFTEPMNPFAGSTLTA
jgi:hypothetical protein